MKINEYYRDTANINLNGSIAALVPTIMIVLGNLSFIKHREIMLLAIPFLFYSLISFQLYLFRMRQSITIKKNMTLSKSSCQSIFEARHLLVLYMNTQFPSLLLYFPDGHLAGRIKKYREKGIKRLRFSKIFALYNVDNQALGFYKVKGRKVISLDVYDQKKKFLGSFKKKNLGWRKSKKELMDSSGRYVGTIVGSTAFMDEQVLDHGRLQVGRLRRGWMPLEWSPLFPEPNTPVLTMWDSLSEEDKLLRMSFLINEYFIER